MPRVRRWKSTEPADPNKTVTGHGLAKIVSKRTGFRAADVELIMETFWATFLEVLANGDSLTVKGVGRFVPTRYKPSLAWDASTGSYVVSYKGRTFTFVAARQHQPLLARKAQEEDATTVAAVLADTPSKSIHNLIQTVQKRYERGDVIDPTIFALLRGAHSDALAREAKRKEAGNTDSPPPEGDEESMDDAGNED
jgi:nucleoid DNA-binding protein